jgi:hypothetical protein
MLKIKMPGTGTSDEAALRYSVDLESGLTNNTYFTNLTPTLDQLKTAQTEYSVALGAAANRGMEEVAVKNEKKAALLSIIRAMVNGINYIADGDRVKLATVGLPMSKEPAPRVLGTPAPKVSLGTNPGVAILSTPAVNGAVSYIHQCTADPAGNNWNEKIVSSSRFQFENLEPGKVYYFRLIAVGTSNQQTISAVISRMVA